MATPNATTGERWSPAGFVSATDHSGALLIINLMGLIITLASTGLRFYLAQRRAANEIAIHKDDLFCFIATIFSILLFSLTWTGVSAGNGKSMDLISPFNLVRIQRIQYAVDIFYIVVLFCSRASAVFLLERLHQNRTSRIWNCMFALVSSWAVASLFITALKCNLAHPWIQYNAQCTGLLARLDAIEISGIIIECAIFICAIYLVCSVRIRVAVKLKALILFGTRALVVILAVFRLVYLSSYIHSSNPTFSGIPAAIFGLAEMYASLIVTTTPLIKSFLADFKVVGQKSTLVFSVKYGSNTVHERPAAEPDSGDTQISKNTEKSTATSYGRTAVSDSTTPSGSTRSPREPWTLRHDCSYAETNISATSKEDESETTPRGRGGIQVSKSYKIATDGD